MTIKTPAQILKQLHALTGPIYKHTEIIESVKNGRPTKYKPEYCLKAINYASMGMSLESISLRLGVFPPTMWRWCKKHKEFFKAIKKAKLIAKDWWIEIGRRNLYNNKFNNVLWMMNMTNRFGWTRADTHFIDKEVKIEKKETKEITININENKIKKISQILEEAGALPEGTTGRVAELISAQVN